MVNNPPFPLNSLKNPPLKKLKKVFGFLKLKCCFRESCEEVNGLFGRFFKKFK